MDVLVNQRLYISETNNTLTIDPILAYVNTARHCMRDKQTTKYLIAKQKYYTLHFCSYLGLTLPTIYSKKGKSRRNTIYIKSQSIHLIQPGIFHA